MEYLLRPRYHLGKVTSKYLIIEILSFMHLMEHALDMMLGSSRELRGLVIRNMKICQENMPKMIKEPKKLFALPNIPQ